MDVAEIKKLDSYLKRLFGSPRIRVVPRPQRDDYAEVLLGEEPFGRIVVDDEDDERSYNFEKSITLPGQPRPPSSTTRRSRSSTSYLKKQLGEKFVGAQAPDQDRLRRPARRRRIRRRACSPTMAVFALEMAILEQDLETEL